MQLPSPTDIICTPLMAVCSRNVIAFSQTHKAHWTTEQCHNKVVLKVMEMHLPYQISHKNGCLETGNINKHAFGPMQNGLDKKNKDITIYYNDAHVSFAMYAVSTEPRWYNPVSYDSSVPTFTIENTRHDPIQLHLFFTSWYVPRKQNFSAPTLSIPPNCDRVICFLAARTKVNK